MLTILFFMVACVFSWAAAGIAFDSLGLTINSSQDFLGFLFFGFVTPFVAVALLCYALVYPFARTTRAFDGTGALLFLLAVAAVVVLSPAAIRNPAFVAQCLVPVAAANLVQWWLIRRRWRIMHRSANPAPG
jgi:hypothetical protein